MHHRNLWQRKPVNPALILAAMSSIHLDSDLLSDEKPVRGQAPAKKVQGILYSFCEIDFRQGELIGNSFFRGAAITAPTDESPRLTALVIYLWPLG
jgi:hypothetical protein